MEKEVVHGLPLADALVDKLLLFYGIRNLWLIMNLWVKIHAVVKSYFVVNLDL